MTTNDNPIEALRAVYEAATPGPWEVRDGMNVKGASSLHVATTMGSETPRRDARAIAATHNVMPELLAVVEAADNAVWRYGDSGESDDRAHQALDNALDALNAKIREALR